MNGKNDLTRLSNEITYHRYMLSHKKAESLYRDISMSEYIALKHISEHKGEKLYLKEIADELEITVQKASKGVRRLRDRGLITWEHDGNGSDGTYVAITETGAKVLDTALILHMEHGGGNNSTFTTRVVTSSGSDTYSTIAAAMASLKGPKHGGANIKVMQMMEDIRAHVGDPADRDEVEAYLERIIDKQAFDRKGLVYGMGHAVYSLSDPRERIFKGYVEKLAAEKGRETDLRLYNNVEKAAPELIAKKRRIFKGVSPNVDFYSGFVYDMLGIPQELYTAIFAVARIVGWSAHRIEELICTDKIIRPAYMSVMEERSLPIGKQKCQD